MELRVCRDCQLAVASAPCTHCGGAVDLLTEADLIGREIGRYRIESVLGSGGMGVVFVARQQSLDRQVALKMVTAHLDDEGFRERFRREARLLAELKHPNIVEIYDLELGPYGVPFYVMERLKGHSLSAAIPADGFSWNDFRRIFEPLARGVSYAHRQGVIHRDLKPANIFLAATGDGEEVVKVLDFGLARMLDPELDTGLTGSGMVLGTPAYMAPEQLDGSGVGPATDQYALGLIAWEMLSGRSARQGSSAGEILSRLHQPPLRDRLPAVVPEHVQKVLDRATSSVAEARFEDVNALLRALVGASTARLSSGSGTLDPGRTAIDYESEQTVISAAGAPALPQADRLHSIPRWPFLLLIPAILALGLWLGGSDLADEGVPISALDSLTTSVASISHEIPLSPVVDMVLASQGGILIAHEPGAILRLDLSTGQTGARHSLDDRDWIAGLDDGSQVLASSSGFELLHPEDGSTEALELSFPAGVSLRAVSADARAWLGEGVQSWWWVERHADDRFAEARSIELPSDCQALALSVRHVACAEPGGVAIVDDSGHTVWRAELPGTGNRGIVAFDEISGLAAIAGWRDEIELVHMPTARTIDRFSAPTRTFAIWLTVDGYLLAAKEGGLWRWPVLGGEGELLLEPPLGARFSGGALIDHGSAVALFDGRGPRVFRVELRPALEFETLSLSDIEVWALGGDQETLIAGTSDGTVHVVDTRSGEIASHRLHTLGVTVAKVVGEHLITASDDRSMAIWNRADMKVIWRTLAHDSLVNWVQLTERPPRLWSASSDGTIKAWSWPQLQEEMAIEVADDASLHAIWIDPSAESIVAGTWNHELQLLERTGDSWRVTGRWPLAAEAVYGLAHAEDADALVLQGIYGRSQLLVWDHAQHRLFEIDSRGLMAMASLALDSKRVLVVGRSGWLVLELGRDPSGDLTVELQASRVSAELATLLSVAPAGPDHVAMATEDGRVLLVDRAALGADPAMTLPLQELSSQD